MNLTIDPELRKLMRALTDEERSALHESLEAEGCREPLAVWKKNGSTILMDGHNRHEWLTKHGKPFDVVEIPGIKIKADAIRWVARNQRGRRNLTPEELAYIRGERYLLEKKEAGGLQSEGVPEGETAERIAEEESVSRATVERDAEYAAAVDTIGEESESAKTALLSRKSKGTRAEVKRAAALPKAKRKQAAEKIAAGKKVKEALPKQKKEPPSDIAKNQAAWKRIAASLNDAYGVLQLEGLIDKADAPVPARMLTVVLDAKPNIKNPKRLRESLEFLSFALSELALQVAAAHSKGKK